ncbi:MAG: hypothetical protein ABJN35_11220 [Erythrobacter sp.]
MNPTVKNLVVAGSLVALAACSGGPRGPSNAVIARALSNAPGAAQPSVIVATEVAYAREAGERGQFVAAVDYAAPGAVLHGRNGPVVFAGIASALQNSDISNQWEPRAVVMSCDGALAISQGRFVDAEGFVGNYVTTWVRQSDNSYKWTYDVAGRDDPQPPRREEQSEDGDIVVTAIDAIQGLVATCPRRGDTVPPPPPIPIGEDGATDAQLSSDGTLRWRWEHRSDGTKYVTADYYYEGQWVTAIEESLASPP